MAFTRLKLTTFGRVIEAKAKQGKGIHFTRLALGDGLLNGASMTNRTELVNERLSLAIDAIVATSDATQSAVITTLDNSVLTEGFMYREQGLFAKDPDTGEEGVYLYDNAGEECEFLDTQANGVVIHERLKIIIRTEDAAEITFDSSGNPLYLTAEDAAELLSVHNEDGDAHPGKADLGEDGKVLPEQLPEAGSSFDDAALKEAELADADSVFISDSADDGAPKRVLWSAVKTLLGKLFVPLTRTVNSKALSANISLTASDVGAAAASHGTHVTFSTTAPVMDGTASVGTAATVARSDHKHPTDTSRAASSHTHPATQVTGLTANRALVSNASGQPAVSAVTATQLSYLSGVTSNIQTQLNNISTSGAKIQTGSYTGTGTYGSANPCKLTFNFSPKLIVFFANQESAIWSHVGSSQNALLIKWGYTTKIENGSYDLPITYSGNTMSWYSTVSAATQFNTSNDIYHWVAIG